MTASDARSQALTDLLTRVRAAWPTPAWEWDGRFGCALSTVTDANRAAGQQSLTTSLPSVWTATNLSDAPAALQAICARTGGLRGGQMVFSTALPEGPLVYCLWWPWGSGTTFSARLGALGEANDMTAVLRAAFGLG